jgi:hypothetical protein
MQRAQVFVLAGEPSGDMLGGRLLDALRDQAGDRLEFFGVGGPRMAERGVMSLFPMEELSLIGFTEILPHLPRLAARLRSTVAEIRRRQPALVLTIDSPGFALRLQRPRFGRGGKSAPRGSRATSTISSRCCRSSRRSSSAMGCPAASSGIRSPRRPAGRGTARASAAATASRPMRR